MSDVNSIWQASVACEQKSISLLMIISYKNLVLLLHVGAGTAVLKAILIPFLSERERKNTSLLLMLHVEAGKIVFKAMLIPFWQASVARERNKYAV